MALCQPKLGGDTGNQFQGIEGLDHIVVSPQHQTVDLVDVGILGGQHDNGKCQLPLPQFAVKLKAVYIRHHHIQNGQVHCFQIVLQGGSWVIVGDHPVVIILQVERDKVHDLFSSSTIKILAIADLPFQPVFPLRIPQFTQNVPSNHLDMR